MKKLYTGPLQPLARNIWTERAKSMIRDGHGERFLFILPTSQLLKSVRNELLTALGGLGPVKLLTFDEIAEEIVGELNPGATLLSTYELHRLYDQMISNLNDHPLIQFVKDHYHLRGVRQSLVKMMGEMKRSGFTLEQAEHVVNHPLAGMRIKALASFYIESEKYIQELSLKKGYLCMTRESRLEEAVKGLRTHSSKLASIDSVETLWIDHFVDFNPLQFELLRELVGLPQLKQAGIYLPYHEAYYENLSYVHPLIKGTINDLLSLGMELTDLTDKEEMECYQLLSADWKVDVDPFIERAMSEKQGFAKLGQALFCDKQVEEDISLEVFAFPSMKSEVQQLAKRIKQLLLSDEQIKPTDVAIIVRDRDRYTSLLDSEFQKEHLPIQLRKQIPLKNVPLVQQFMAFLEVKTGNWHRDAITKLAQSSYFQWDSPISGYFSTWIKKKGLLQGSEAWRSLLENDLALLQKRKEQNSFLNNEDAFPGSDQLEAESTEILLSLAWLKEIEGKLSVIPSTATMLEYIGILGKWLDGLEMPKQISLLAKNSYYRKEWLRRDMGALSTLKVSLRDFAQSIERLGERQRKVSISLFVREWIEQWEEETVEWMPGNDQGIYCLEPSAARGLQFKRVYVIGCNEGLFPKTHRENWLLDDAERSLLQAYGKLPASHYQNEMEQIFFLMSIALPTEYLSFSYVSSEEEGLLQPSSFINQLYRTLPHMTIMHLKDDWAVAAERISSSYEYRHWLMKMGRIAEGAVHLYRTEWFPFSQFTQALQGVKMEQDRQFGAFSEWDGNLKSESITQNLARMFSSSHRFSVSQINEYSSSPLTFFFRRVLGVESREEGSLEVSAVEKGTLLHETLRRFYSHYRGISLKIEELERYQKELKFIFFEEASLFAAGTIYENSKLWKLETQRLFEDLKEWLAKEIRESTGFYPGFLELSFGLPFTADQEVDPASQEGSIELSIGQESIRLFGKIDRIDRDQEGHFILYDYKLSLSKYGDYKELSDGTLNFQLPLYLALVRQWLKETGEGSPIMVGGAFYSLRKRDLFKKVGIWSEDKREQAGLSKRIKKGVFASLDARIEEDLLQINNFLHRLRQGDFYLTSTQRPNPYYADNAIYRYNAISVRHKEKQKGGREHEPSYTNPTGS